MDCKINDEVAALPEQMKSDKWDSRRRRWKKQQRKGTCSGGSRKKKFNFKMRPYGCSIKKIGFYGFSCWCCSGIIANRGEARAEERVYLRGLLKEYSHKG